MTELKLNREDKRDIMAAILLAGSEACKERILRAQQEDKQLENAFAFVDAILDKSLKEAVEHKERTKAAMKPDVWGG